MKFILTLAEVHALVTERYNLPHNTEVTVLRPGRTAINKNTPIVSTLTAALSRVPVYDSYGHSEGTESVFDGFGLVIPSKKIAAIKALRTVIPGLGLADAKRAVETWPVFIAYVQKHGLPPVGAFQWDG